MIIPPAPRSLPVGFNRHVTAVLGANFIAATLLAVYTGALTAIETRSPSLVLMLSIVTWLGVFAMAAPASGLLFTIAFPLLRRARERGLLISVLLGATGGCASMWSNYAAATKHASVSELGTATLIGAVLGGAYWLIAGHTPKTATALEVSDEAETETETQEDVLRQA